MKLITFSTYTKLFKEIGAKLTLEYYGQKHQKPKMGILEL